MKKAALKKVEEQRFTVNEAIILGYLDSLRRTFEGEWKGAGETAIHGNLFATRASSEEGYYPKAGEDAVGKALQALEARGILKAQAGDGESLNPAHTRLWSFTEAGLQAWQSYDPSSAQEDDDPAAGRTATGEAEEDDGMRFKCSSCESYLKPDPEGSGMKCDACGEWFTLCDECMPDVESYSSDAVWLCSGCR